MSLLIIRHEYVYAHAGDNNWQTSMNELILISWSICFIVSQTYTVFAFKVAFKESRVVSLSAEVTASNPVKIGNDS